MVEKEKKMDPKAKALAILFILLIIQTSPQKWLKGGETNEKNKKKK